VQKGSQTSIRIFSKNVEGLGMAVLNPTEVRFRDGSVQATYFIQRLQKLLCPYIYTSLCFKMLLRNVPICIYPSNDARYKKRHRGGVTCAVLV